MPNDRFAPRCRMSARGRSATDTIRYQATFGQLPRSATPDLLPTADGQQPGKRSSDVDDCFQYRRPGLLPREQLPTRPTSACRSARAWNACLRHTRADSADAHVGHIGMTCRSWCAPLMTEGAPGSPRRARRSARSTSRGRNGGTRRSAALRRAVCCPARQCQQWRPARRRRATARAPSSDLPCESRWPAALVPDAVEATRHHVQQEHVSRLSRCRGSLRLQPRIRLAPAVAEHARSRTGPPDVR